MARCRFSYYYVWSGTVRTLGLAVSVEKISVTSQSDPCTQAPRRVIFRTAKEGRGLPPSEVSEILFLVLVLKTYEHQLKGIIIEYNKSRALTKVNIDGVGNYKARS